ncbi:hypothetical protein AALP_AA6G065100 [Arabis alpina]|uniref:RNase H type-1 domain-containing protein n=1 Tax=Arabis alpina TaxID=50452 RepID=A0A087GMH4_ARAAL|nr:hypothetical protein AALP_AA6G065100 [Arabis alpina]
MYIITYISDILFVFIRIYSISSKLRLSKHFNKSHKYHNYIKIVDLSGDSLKEVSSDYKLRRRFDIIVSLKGLGQKCLLYVYKMNLESGKWERVDSLGGEMLIFGHGVTIRAPVKDISGGRIKSDSVCFLHNDLWPSKDDFGYYNRDISSGVFDLVTNTIRYESLFYVFKLIAESKKCERVECLGADEILVFGDGFTVASSCQEGNLIYYVIDDLLLPMEFAINQFSGGIFHIQTAVPSWREQCRSNIERSLVVCYTDAAWRADTKEAGLGWIVKDHNNITILQGSALVDHVSNPLMAEALSMREALTQLKHRNLQHLSISSDSNQLISLINNGMNHMEIYGVLHDIISLSKEIGIISFNFISRTLNGKSDRIAKNVLYLGRTFTGPNTVCLN